MQKLEKRHKCQRHEHWNDPFDTLYAFCQWRSANGTSEALAVHDRGARLIVLFFWNPHVFKGDSRLMGVFWKLLSAPKKTTYFQKFFFRIFFSGHVSKFLLYLTPPITGSNFGQIIRGDPCDQKKVQKIRFFFWAWKKNSKKKLLKIRGFFRCTTKFSKNSHKPAIPLNNTTEY